MMFLEQHSARLTLRDVRRTAAIGLGIALAAALVTTVVLFGIASGSTLTRRALAGVPVDAQVALAAPGSSDVAIQTVNSDPAVTTALPYEQVAFDTAALNKSGTATQTSSGALVAVDATYVQTTGLFAPIEAAPVSGQVAISRDLATNLGAVAGDSIRFTLPGGSNVDIVVSGIVDIAGADLVLGPTDAAHRATGVNPPTNVAVTDRTTLDAISAGIPADATPAAPPGQGAAPGSPVASALQTVRREIHLRYDRSLLPGDPVTAQAWLDEVRHRVELQGAGAFSVVDDAAASLEPIAADLLWGQVLFVFLALPGVLLALATSRLAADATAEATRRHVALLRSRGATRRQLLRVLLGSTAGVALGASVLGSVVGASLAWLRFGADLTSVNPVQSTIMALAFGIAFTTILATIAAWLPLREQLRDEIALGRQEIQRARPPFWQRYYLDILAIIGAAAIFVATGGTGLHPVFNAEGNPTVTLAFTSFLSPFLLWLGATFLLLRVARAFLQRGSVSVGWLAALLGPGGDLAAHSLRARAPGAARTIVLLGLTVSFATSLLVFDATYRQQQRVDAELTLGADLKLTPASATTSSATATVIGPGVESATPFVDRIVYVGTEAQDLLAIDPVTLPQTSPLADAFFDGATAAAAMSALAGKPDAILVSSETAHDYSIVSGDQLMIRIPDAHGVLTTVTFHMAGIALEFPTAPKDAFLVANLSYVAAQTGNDNITFVLARASGDVAAAAHEVTGRLGPDWQVADLEATSGRLANAITSVDLAGLVWIEILFAVLIGSVGSALFLLAELSSRRRELATIEAIGATPRQLRSALGGEMLVMGGFGVLVGLIVGCLVGATLLQTLAGLFDPPAQFPAIPVVAIAGLVGAVALGLLAALAVASRALARMGILSALRER